MSYELNVYFSKINDLLKRRKEFYDVNKTGSNFSYQKTILIKGTSHLQTKGKFSYPMHSVDSQNHPQLIEEKPYNFWIWVQQHHNGSSLLLKEMYT